MYSWPLFMGRITRLKSSAGRDGPSLSGDARPPCELAFLATCLRPRKLTGKIPGPRTQEADFIKRGTVSGPGKLRFVRKVLQTIPFLFPFVMNRGDSYQYTGVTNTGFKVSGHRVGSPEYWAGEVTATKTLGSGADEAVSQIVPVLHDRSLCWCREPGCSEGSG